MEGMWQGKLQARCGTSPRERSLLLPIRLKGIGNPKSPLTSDMGTRNLEFALLASDFALVQNFIAGPPSFSLEMVMYILCHSILEVCVLVLILIFQGVTVKRTP